MLRVGINGLGRIGRAVFHIIHQCPDLQIVAVNDVNPEAENLAYLLKYDSHYGRRCQHLSAESEGFRLDGRFIPVSHHANIGAVDWAGLGCDAVIESAGAHANLQELPGLLETGLRKVLVTYAPDAVDHTLVLGVNEDTYQPHKHHIISTSICDVVAFAPVYQLMDAAFGIEGGFLTTLHPWLSYQNLLDGPSNSWAWPGQLYHHYAVGRASTASIIPKPTTAIAAAARVLSGIEQKMKCYSFRIPTPVVGAADITFQLSRSANPSDIMHAIESTVDRHKWPLLYVNQEPLVSVDFMGTDYSAVIDSRWMEMVNERLVKLTLWYDNEWGYSRRVVDVLRHVMEMPAQHLGHHMHHLHGGVKPNSREIFAEETTGERYYAAK